MATTVELLRSNRIKPLARRFREQAGTVVERRDGFYLRYYVDRNGERVKVTERLCDLGEKTMVIDIKRRRRIDEINLAQSSGEHVAVDETLSAFWERVYLPWAEKNLKPSTVRGYEKLWKTLEPMVGARPMKQFRRVDGSDFLTSLVERGWGRRSMQHAQSLLSGIFTRAVAKEVVSANPMQGAKPDIRPAEPEARIAYTASEVDAILDAIERTDAKLLFALCAYMGVRPSEAAALKWERCKPSLIEIRIAAPYGVAQDSTKSKRGIRDLILIEPVKSLLAAWKAACGDPETGWLFSRPGDRPINHSALVARWIAPAARKVCSRWAGLYPGRHSVATELCADTGNANASHQVLGNSRSTVERDYIKPVQEAGDAALRQREAAYLSRQSKTT